MTKKLLILIVFAIGMFLLIPFARKVEAYFSFRKIFIVTDRFCQDFGAEAMRRYGWQPHTYFRTFHDGLKELELTFITSEGMNTDQARTAVIQLCDALLIAINDSSNLRPYLNHYPFTVRDISLTLYPKGNKREGAYFGDCTLRWSEMSFFDLNDSGEHQSIKKVRQETWEEAVARHEEWLATQSR